jgi:diacylglycerol O-acyltransferase / trehalose O-mycolyltransferase
VLRRLAPVLAVAGSAVLLAPGAAGAWPACSTRTTPVRTGLTELARVRQGRLLTLTLRSRAMQGDQHVNVLLPAHFDASGRTRYPVLYLLHGAGGDYTSWVQNGVGGIVGRMPLIVVMPDGGTDGGYSDWFAVPPARMGPPPAYESYDIDELIPYIDRTLPTRAGPAGRAIAGLSMGGHGSTKYAAEYPGTFAYVGAFSGAVDIELPIYQAAIQQCTWGDPATEEVVWRDNDPTALAGNLRGVDLFVRSGDGTPGPYDSPTRSRDLVETVVGEMNTAFLAALRKAGVRGVDAKVGKGTHTWPYWRQDLREFLGWLAPRLRRPFRAPRSFSVQSAHTRFSAWGFGFRARRNVREFSYLRVDGDELVARGSGTLEVVTPARFSPRRAYLVGKRRVRADAGGRLGFALDLGPSHTRQQTEFGPMAASGWHRVRVRIRSGA